MDPSNQLRHPPHTVDIVVVMDSRVEAKDMVAHLVDMAKVI